MREHYDFAKMQGRKNPHIKQLKQPVTIRLDQPTVAYFKALAKEAGMPYQSLINLYLRDCAQKRKKLSMRWVS
ncbi:MAG TPA: BrnA antitoxin family protein [Candidatus Hydrogenedentes bacterium]|nr:BrnA antitoxin family protein [Candidatus Hydrogenedentota bacterium]HNT87299.1 BrnA antitoxin family protein [Candidatus Hydrogenedentota bacterium]